MLALLSRGAAADLRENGMSVALFVNIRKTMLRRWFLRRLAAPRFSAPDYPGSVSSRLIPRDPLDFQKVVEAVFRIFAAVARLLVAAERQPGVPDWIVDIDIAGPHPPGDLACLGDILGLDIG